MLEINLKKYNKIILILFILCSLFLIVEYYCYYINGIMNDIAIGLFVSSIFYYIVISIPAYLDKEAQKKVFLNFYEEFRINITREILCLSEFCNNSKIIEDKVRELLDVKKLDLFFVEDNKKNKGQKNCHTMMNNIWKAEYRWSLDIIVNKVDELRREINFLISKVQIDDPELLEWIRKMDRILSDGRFKKDIDWQFVNSEKRFIEDLWELLTGRNLIDSYIGDFVKDRIKKL